VEYLYRIIGLSTKGFLLPDAYNMLQFLLLQLRALMCSHVEHELEQIAFNSDHISFTSAGGLQVSGSTNLKVIEWLIGTLNRLFWFNDHRIYTAVYSIWTKEEKC
jgi:hypothetical protein